MTDRSHPARGGAWECAPVGASAAPLLAKEAAGLARISDNPDRPGRLRAPSEGIMYLTCEPMGAETMTQRGAGRHRRDGATAYLAHALRLAAAYPRPFNGIGSHTGPARHGRERTCALNHR
jgi:hypothetical protein